MSRTYQTGVIVNAGKQSTVALTWSFFAPSLTSPTAGSASSQTTPAFVWSVVAGVVAYQLQVDDNDNFNSPIIDKADLTINSYTPENPLFN